MEPLNISLDVPILNWQSVALSIWHLIEVAFVAGFTVAISVYLLLVAWAYVYWTAEFFGSSGKPKVSQPGTSNTASQPPSMEELRNMGVV